jgi:hypothetical protein
MTPFGAPPKTYTYPGPASMGQAVLDRCAALKQPFAPTPWAVNGHAQVRSPPFPPKPPRNPPTHPACGCVAGLGNTERRHLPVCADR